MDRIKSGKKPGWTLVEVVVAMIALSILIGLTVQVIKPKKILVAPFAFAALQNLKEGNNYVISRCKEHSFFGCDGASNLPDTEIAIEQEKDANPGFTPPAGYMERYCLELSQVFTILSDFKCEWGKGDSYTKLPKGNGKDANKGIPNFQTSNMVSYYFLERPWTTTYRGIPSEDDPYAIQETKVKEIMIDINGDDKPNRVGEDQFPVKVFITGEIVPGTCTAMSGNDPDGVGASIEKSPHCEADGTQDNNFLTLSHPFAYNLYKSEIDEDSPDGKRKTSKVLMSRSYQRAACNAGRDNMLPRAAICPTSDSDLEFLEECKSGALSAFCITRLSKPSTSGLFRLPIF